METTEKHMRNYQLIVLAGILFPGCTSIATTNERSDRQPAIESAPVVIREQKPEPVTRLAWQPGRKDTDGKPGEPNCADCDGGGPAYLASIRPSR
jgi:hypothetical protein